MEMPRVLDAEETRCGRGATSTPEITTCAASPFFAETEEVASDLHRSASVLAGRELPRRATLASGLFPCPVEHTAQPSRQRLGTICRIRIDAGREP
jgi:hypothetical protein